MAGGPVGGHGPNLVMEFAVDKRLIAADGVAAAAAFGIALLFAPQQAYTDVQPVVWSSSVAGKTPRFIQNVSAAPQSDPAQIAPRMLGSQVAGKTPTVPPFTVGVSQYDPTPIAAQIWQPQPAPSVPRTLASFTTGAPQVDPSQLSAEVWAPATAPIGGGVIAAGYTWGTHALALWSAEGTKSRFVPSITSGLPPIIGTIIGGPLQIDLSQQALISVPALVRQGAVPPTIIGIPQADPTQLAADVWVSQPAAPIVAGVTVWPNAAIPPQFDPSINATALWTHSTFSPSRIDEPETLDTHDGVGGGARIIYKRPHKKLHDEIEEYFSQIGLVPTQAEVAAIEEVVAEYVPNIEARAAVEKAIRAQVLEVLSAREQTQELRELMARVQDEDDAIAVLVMMETLH